MGIMKKAIENGKKIAKASVKLMPKGKVGNVKVEETAEVEEEMEVEETPVEEEVEEEIEEVPQAPALKSEIKFIVGEIITYAKEVGYVVTNTDGKPIECESYAQAILVAQAVKNETKIQPN